MNTDTAIFSKERTLAVKGFAIAAMLFHHCFMAPKIYAGYTVNFAPFSQGLVTNIALFGKLCVGLFAFVSGYGLSIKWKQESTSYYTRQNYFISRYFSTMSAYWFVFLLCCLICQYADGLTGATYFAKTIPENILGFLASFLGIGHLLNIPTLIYEWWYMSAAICFILLVPLFCYGIDRLGGCAVAVSLVLLPRMLGISFLGGTQPFSFLMPVFLGVLFEKKHTFEKINNWICCHFHRTTGKIVLVAAGLVWLFLAYKLYRRLPFEQYWEIKYGLVPLMIIIFLTEVFAFFPRIQRLFIYLGKHSTNIYLTHMLFLRYLKAFLFSDRYFLVSWAILLLLTLAASVVIETVKKRIRWDSLVISVKQRLFPTA